MITFHVIPTEEVIQARLDEWVGTWKRDRKFIGFSTGAIDLVKPGLSKVPEFVEEENVFRGKMLPSYEEWLEMRDNYLEHIPVWMPWEDEFGPEKFMRWYPTYREEVMDLLEEPYDFETKREVWMFGYGSLISPDNPPEGSDERQHKMMVPYWLQKEAGYERHWNYRAGEAGINAVGLLKVGQTEGDNICGCVYPIDYEIASALFTEREDGYELLLVHESFFAPMHTDFQMPKGIGYVWICGQPSPSKHCKTSPSGACLEANPSRTLTACTQIKCNRHVPTKDSPILQTYVDCIVRGALRYDSFGIGKADGMRFAAAILKSTRGWDDAPWWNDREIPGRPWLYAPDWALIDGLLSTAPTVRKAFLKRMIHETRETEPATQAMHEKVAKEHFAGWADWFYKGVGAPSTRPTPIKSKKKSSSKRSSPLPKFRRVRESKKDGSYVALDPP